MQIRIENYIGEIKYFRKKKSLGFKSLLKETQEGKRSHHPRVKKLLDFRLLLGKEKSALQKPTPKTKNCFLSQNRHFLKTRLKHRAKTPPLGYNVSKIRATAKGGGSVRAERAQAHRLFGTLFCSSFFVRVRTTTNPFELFLNSFGLLRVFFFLSLGGNKLAVATAFFFLARDGGGSNVERVSSSVNLTTLAPGVKTCIERATETKEEEEERRRKKEGDARFFFFFLELSYTVPADSFALVVCI